MVPTVRKDLRQIQSLSTCWSSPSSVGTTSDHIHLFCIQSLQPSISNCSKYIYMSLAQPRFKLMSPAGLALHRFSLSPPSLPSSSIILPLVLPLLHWICCEQWSSVQSMVRACGWHKAFFLLKKNSWFWTSNLFEGTLNPLCHRYTLPVPQESSFSKDKTFIPPRIGLPRFFIILTHFFLQKSLCQCLTENLNLFKKEQIGSTRVHSISSGPYFSILSMKDVLGRLYKNALLKIAWIYHV